MQLEERTMQPALVLGMEFPSKIAHTLESTRSGGSDKSKADSQESSGRRGVNMVEMEAEEIAAINGAVDEEMCIKATSVEAERIDNKDPRYLLLFLRRPRRTRQGRETAMLHLWQASSQGLY